MPELPVDRMLKDADLGDRIAALCGHGTPHGGVLGDLSCHVRALAEALEKAGAENDALRADRDRLDWVQASGRELIGPDPEDANWLVEARDGLESFDPDVRLAIDAAREGTPAATHAGPGGRWPLGVNPGMDAHAADRGFPHWCCVSPDSNTWWVRRDGHTCEATFRKTHGYLDDLRQYDEDYPYTAPPES